MGDEPQPIPGQSTAGQTPEVPKWGDGTRAGTAPGGAQPQRTEFIRDAVGRLIDKRTPAHHYHYRYDALDQLLEAKKLAVQPDGSLKPLHTTRFEYDAVGNLIAETATNETTGQSHTHTLRHEQDLLGNRLQTTLPALPGQETTERALNYLHYGSGHLHQINFSQRSIQSDKKNQDGPDDQEAPATHQLICDIERDALHRETQRTQGKATTRYALDPLGRRTGAWSRSSSLTSAPFSANDTDWQRAILSAGTSEARPLNGLMKAYAYDKAGELRQSRHSLQGDIAHRYDATGRIEETRRAPFAQAAKQTAPSERFQYDPAGNILDNQSQAALAKRTQHLQGGYVKDNLVRVYEDKRYAYDGHGRLIQKLSGKHTAQSFSWDEENRLESVSTTRRPGTEHETTQTTKFDYDAIGRRVAKHDSFGTTVFIWEGMRLIEERRGASVISYVYEPGSYVPLARLDANGEATEQGGLGTTDDAEEAATNTENTTKTIAGSARESSARGLKDSEIQAPAANDAEAQYWAALETTAQQRAKATGTYGSANASANTTPKLCNVYYFHTDQVGMPEELTNADGQVCWQASYKTWGSTVSESWEVKELAGRKVHQLDEGDKLQGDSAEQNLRFQGQYLDRETGLHYNTFRFYDADIGRFISPDPIGLSGGLNLGSYSPNPISWIDPWGWACGHGNAKTGTKAQHGYEIIDTHRGSAVVKTGVSQSVLKTNAEGVLSSPRANTQVRRQNGLPGNEGRYKARVVKQIPEGPGARQKILDWEIANTNKNGATLDPKIHKLPKPQQ